MKFLFEFTVTLTSGEQLSPAAEGATSFEAWAEVVAWAERHRHEVEAVTLTGSHPVI